MSDTYNYNAGGFPNAGGCGFSPFGGMGGFGGCGGWGMEWIVMFLFFGLFGWGGGGFGGFGGAGGAGLLGATSLTATETASLVGQQAMGEKVSSTAFGVNQILGQTGGIIEQVQRTSDRIQDGFSRMDTNLCQLGNNIAMQAVNNQNATTALLNDMRFASQQCCCETKSLIESKFCTLSHQLQTDKCETLAAIRAEGDATRALLRDMETAKLREELAAAKGQLSRNAETAQIIAAYNASKGGCNPCATSACNPCGNVLCAVQDAFAEQVAQRIINPTTTPTT